MAPPVLIYVWAHDELGALGWIAALIFVICGALRLARFNVALEAPNRSEWQSSYFVGVPAPAGAMISTHRRLAAEAAKDDEEKKEQS